MPAPNLRQVRTFKDLIRYLEEELHWPLEGYEMEDLTFDYEPADLGLKDEDAAKVKTIRQLRPLASDQPWGIFFIEFDKKKLPVVLLRRILSHLVVRKRASANKADRAAWNAEDLLFVSAFGPDDDDGREIGFAHFHQESGDLPTLRVLNWDGADTKLKLKDLDKTLHDRLHWPTKGESIVAWHARWAGAFRHRLGHVLRTADELAEALASLAKRIRDAATTLMEHETEKGPLTKLHRAFQANLIHDLTAESFADTYAQTITYGLLTAAVSRTDVSDGGGGTALVASNVADMVPVTNPFLKEMLQTFLHAGGRKGGLDFDELGVQDVVDLLRDPKKTDLRAVLLDFGNKTRGEDPVIHFYEHFLSAYNHELRVKRGVFYTPQPAVSYIVRSVHELLQTEFGLEDGLADTTTWGTMLKKHPGLKLPPLTDEPGEKCAISPDEPFVQILDPATGTATFLVEVIDVIYRTLKEKWQRQRLSQEQQRGAWNNYVIQHLLCRLTGFELMMAPYAIAHMKIGLKLSETGFSAWSQLDDANRVRIYLTNSLEPSQDFSERLAFDVPALAHEAQAVNRVKGRTPFTVIVGNPPYLREKERGPGERVERIGGWVRFGETGDKTPPLFDDFIKSLSDTNQGVHAKLAYELSVMFWRLAMWWTFERRSTPGIIGIISPRAYIAGPGHTGMRKWIRSHSTDFWVTDLGGDNRGARKSSNIFEIETGVTIGVCVKSPRPANHPCAVRYSEIIGSGDQKLAALRDARQMNSLPWGECPPDSDAFMPASGGSYAEWPKLTDLFPWQHSGSQFKRLWPIAESTEVLEKRWRRLLALPANEKSAAFVETDARLVSDGKPGRHTLRHTGIAVLPKTAPLPPIRRYCYRSLDRQWAFVDERFADRLRPNLVSTLGPRQIFAVTLMSKQLGDGPAVGITSCLPDMDSFCNRGAKDVIPLWRNASATQPNVAGGMLTKLSTVLGSPVSPEELFVYCAAILGSPAYAEMFEQELATPGPRIPLTADPSLFRQGTLLGAQFVWLQTYGDRWLATTPNPNKKLAGSAKVKRAIQDDPDHYPNEFNFDAATGNLQVGGGIISGVSPAVFGYSQSGFKPVESWLRYRMKERGGRAGREKTRSELDRIRPQRWTFTQELLELLWVVEGCVLLWPSLRDFLGEVVVGKQIPATSLPLPTEAERNEPSINNPQQQLELI